MAVFLSEMSVVSYESATNGSGSAPAVRLGGYGDTFSASLLSNLAPLVTLFGEQVSKQFISQMTSRVICIIFAVPHLEFLQLWSARSESEEAKR